MEIPRANGVVTLLTDFGTDDPYVGMMKGMVKRHGLRTEIIDLCHGVAPHDIAAGAFFLAAAVGRFPAGTVHVAVVDPGVGTERRFLAACAAECFWLAPDNGLLDGILARPEVEARAVDVASMNLRPTSSTFHGRDVFAPLAGMLSTGRYSFRALGERIADAVRLPAHTGGPRVVCVDRFGSLILDVTADEVARRGVTGVRIGSRAVPLRQTYRSAALGEPLALINSYDLLEVAVCEGRADHYFGIGRDATVDLLLT
jgi:S-adenosylmethionine hydrolase